MRHKVFISYHHANDQWYKNELLKLNQRFIKWSNVLRHCDNNRTMLNAFENFRRRVNETQPWSNPQKIIKSNSNSDLVTCKKTKQNRIVFNIGNNKYRMIVGYHFSNLGCLLFIKFVGTHSEYDKIDACSVDMFKE